MKNRFFLLMVLALALVFVGSFLYTQTSSNAIAADKTVVKDNAKQGDSGCCDKTKDKKPGCCDKAKEKKPGCCDKNKQADKSCPGACKGSACEKACPGQGEKK